jgi:hypothetical protein
MRICLFSFAGFDMYRCFLHRHYRELSDRGLHVVLVVVDEDTVRKTAFWRHAKHLAKRQSKYSGCHWASQLLRILFFKLFTLGGNSRKRSLEPLPGGVRVVRVPTLNSEACVEAVKQAGCDLGCLMGTRIITSNTLEALGIPLLNIHASAPRFVRGGPSFFWEILGGRDSVTLTIHEVDPGVDTGRIYQQKRHSITYAGGLRRTLAKTSESAAAAVTALFRDVLIELSSGPIDRTEFVPGPLRVTPAVSQTLRADRLCREKAHRKLCKIRS